LFGIILSVNENRLTIRINKPAHEVFTFAITPPNSTRWISSVVKEETNEWPVRIGTIYKLQDKNGKLSEVVVTAIKENKFVEWVSKDQVYHCRYTFKSINKNTSELEYYEWVDKGELEEPFTLDVLKKLKSVVESQQN